MEWQSGKMHKNIMLFQFCCFIFANQVEKRFLNKNLTPALIVMWYVSSIPRLSSSPRAYLSLLPTTINYSKPVWIYSVLLFVGHFSQCVIEANVHQQWESKKLTFSVFLICIPYFAKIKRPHFYLRSMFWNHC